MTELNVYYVRNELARIALPGDFELFYIQPTNEQTEPTFTDLLITSDGAKINQLLVIAENETIARALFNDKYINKVEGLELSNQSFDDKKFIGLSQ
ncbi:MAG: hypothetical protein ACKO96_04840 [Flammeovirgaceae bacterium]